MKDDDIVDIKTFANYVGMNYTHLCRLCSYPSNRKPFTATSERKYKGIPLPLPLCKNFTSYKKKWLGKDVIAFKTEVDKVKEVV